MSHQVVYRKYRSHDFSELIGQNHISSTISSQIKSLSIGHAYLFFGPRGTGKTSAARIVAKTVNCLTPLMKGDFLLPCGVCESCKNFSLDDMDILEMDAASNRGIDDARLLKEKVLSQPLSHKYKVIILDEAHMLTREAVNALLKIIEEPPSYVIFIFCTTEFNKIPITIASRCQRFKFLLANDQDILFKLEKISQSEGFEIEKQKLEIIAKLAKGSFRDAESLLEQVLYSDDSYTNDLFSLYLNTDLLNNFLLSIQQNDLAKMWIVLNQFENSQQGDFKQLLDLALEYASSKFVNKEIEFSNLLSLIKLVGSVRGDTKEEIIYKYSLLFESSSKQTNFVDNASPKTPIPSLLETSKSTNLSLNSISPTSEKFATSESYNAVRPDSDKTNLANANTSSSGSLDQIKFMDLFKDKTGIFNLLLKANIRIDKNIVYIDVNSTVSKLFLQKNNLLRTIKERYLDVSEVIINVVKSEGNLQVESGKKDIPIDSKITDIENIFQSKFH